MKKILHAIIGKGFILSIFLIVFIDMLGLSIAIPILAPLFLDPNGILPASYDLGFRTMLYGFAIAAFPLFQFFGAPILGALSDRYGRKKMLIVSIAGMIISYIVIALAIMFSNIPLLFIGRAVGGFMGGNIAIALSAISDISDEKTKAKNFGLVGMAFGLGFIIGPFLGGTLADPTLVNWFNYATPFWAAAALSIINILMILKIFPETLKTRIHTKLSLFTGFKNIGKAFHMKNLRIMFLVVFLFTFGFTFYTQFFQVYLIEKFQFTQSQIGDFFAFMGFWVAFTQGVLMRFLTKKFVPATLIKASIFVSSIAFILLLFPTKAYLLFFILPFVAISQGITQPNSTAIISNLSAKDSQGEILGINQSIQSLAFTIPPIIAGFIASISITLPIIVASTCMFFAWIVFILLFREKEREVFKEI